MSSRTHLIFFLIGLLMMPAIQSMADENLNALHRRFKSAETQSTTLAMASSTDSSASSGEYCDAECIGFAIISAVAGAASMVGLGLSIRGFAQGDCRMGGLMLLPFTVAGGLSGAFGWGAWKAKKDSDE